MRFYVDSRVNTILEVDIQGKGGKGFWDRGGSVSFMYATVRPLYIDWL